MSLAKTVTDAVGQPSTVRIGVVTSVNPLVINVQGTLFTNVGVIPSFAPAAGQTVALLGQSAVSSDGSSWLCLGKVTPSASAISGAITVGMEEDTVFTSGTGGFTTAGAPLCGVVFTAPASGKVVMHWSGDLHQNSVNFALLAPQIALGAVLGAGTVFMAASNPRSIQNDNLNFINAGSSRLVSGLTPGTVYNLTLYHGVSGGVGTFAFRSVTVVPQLG